MQADPRGTRQPGVGSPGRRSQSGAAPRLPALPPLVHQVTPKALLRQKDPVTFGHYVPLLVGNGRVTPGRFWAAPGPWCARRGRGPAECRPCDRTCSLPPPSLCAPPDHHAGDEEGLRGRRGRAGGLQSCHQAGECGPPSVALWEGGSLGVGALSSPTPTPLRPPSSAPLSLLCVDSQGLLPALGPL